MRPMVLIRLAGIKGRVDGPRGRILQALVMVLFGMGVRPEALWSVDRLGEAHRRNLTERSEKPAA